MNIGKLVYRLLQFGVVALVANMVAISITHGHWHQLPEIAVVAAVLLLVLAGLRSVTGWLVCAMRRSKPRERASAPAGDPQRDNVLWDLFETEDGGRRLVEEMRREADDYSLGVTSGFGPYGVIHMMDQQRQHKEHQNHWRDLWGDR
jgi:hypothetical protein